MPKWGDAPDDSELRTLTDGAALARAFELAHSIYRFREKDRAVALEVVWEALRGVEVRMVTQREADRHAPRRPTKVRWNTLQWFQLLIYCKSEIHERRQEASGGEALTQSDMIIRYIKHLVFTTSRRNSFYMTLGLTRLLYDYGTGEAMAVYDFVFQDPDVSTRKADAYYRGRKGRLMDELGRRFPDLLRVCHGPDMVKRFQAQPDSLRFGGLVTQCLARFTPWGVSCALPTPLDTWTSVHPLRNSQERQMHSLLHPACFEQITRALRLALPESRLALPLFLLPDQSGEGPPRDGGERPSTPLAEAEADLIREKVREERLRRRKFTPWALRVLADGGELGRFELSRSECVRFDVPDHVALIELVGVDEDVEVLLASHVITRNEDDELAARLPDGYTLDLEGGQKLSLLVSPPTSQGAAAHNFSIEVRYQRGPTTTVPALWPSRLWRPLTLGGLADSRRAAPPFGFGWAVTIIAVAVAALLLYISLRPRPNASPEIARREQPPPVATQTPMPASPPAVNKNNERPPAERQSKPQAGEDLSGPRVTRGPRRRVVKTPGDIERLYVGLTAEDSFAAAVRQKLLERLPGLSLFAVTESRTDADAALFGAVRSEGGGGGGGSGQGDERGTATLEVVNVSGEVIWRSRKVRGTADEVASSLANDLLTAVRDERLRRR